MQNTSLDLQLLNNVISLLWKALGATLGILIVLIGVIYHQLRDNDKEMQSALDDGYDGFEEIRLTLNTLKHEIVAERVYHDKDLFEKVQVAKFKIKALEEKIAELDTDIAALDLAYKDHDKALTLIKDHHRRNHGEEVK